MAEKNNFKLEIENGICTITFQRPKTLNSITFEVYRELEVLTGELQEMDEVKVVVITGEGKGFCSGGDVHTIIGELFKRDMKGVLEFTRMTGNVVKNLRLLDKPVISSINGICAGAGAVIALASDFRIFSTESKIAFLFQKVGLTGADMGAAYLLPKVIGFGRATEVLMLGDSIYPDKAKEIGLAYKVVSPENLEEETQNLAERLNNSATLALSMTKRMLNNEYGMDLVSAIEQEAQAQALMLMGKDHKEFYNSFVEKRKPEFKGN